MNFNCPVCGKPMVHARLRGYYCWNESHNRLAAERSQRVLRAFTAGRITEAEWDAWIDNHIMPEKLKQQGEEYATGTTSESAADTGI